MTAEWSGSAVRRVWTITRPGPLRGVLSCLLAGLALVSAIGLIATSGWLISRAWERPPILALSVAVITVRACGIGRAAFRYAERLVSHDAALRGLSHLRAVVVDRVASLAPGGLGATRHGDALRRIVDDVDTVSELSLRIVLPASAAVLVGGTVVGFAVWLVPMVGVMLAIGLLIAGMIAPWLAAGQSKHATAAVVALRGDLAAQITGQLAACADLSAANAQEREMERLVRIDRALRSAESRSAWTLSSSVALGVLAQGIALAGAVVFAVPAVRSGQLPGVDLAVAVLLPLVAFESVAALPAAAITWGKTRASAERIVDLTDRPDPVADPVVAVRAPRGVPELAVRELTVTWPGRGLAAVRNVSFRVSPGERVAIVGPSGGGKSTIAAALVRFVKYRGSVSLGHVPLDQMTGAEVREVICLAGQEPHVFDNTIAENVRLARPGSTDDQVRDALAAAGARGWIETLPLGVSTAVGEHGSAVSGGQRQRIALARAILANRPITIFDEPVEHLDPVAGQDLLGDLLSVNPQGSVLIISHTLLGLTDVDQIVAVSDGEVMESGSPAHLLSRDSWFRRQYDRQLRAREESLRCG